MGKFSDELLFGMTIRESATDGSDFTNPAADYRRLFLGEDGQLHVRDSAGTVTDIGSGSGAVATDAIWDAAGDLAVGTGANTAAKLSAGATSGHVLTSNGSAAAPSWQAAPGGTLTGSTTLLGSPVTMTTANTFYDGPSVVLSAGTWLIGGHLSLDGPGGGAAGITVKLWNGTTVAASCEGTTAAASYETTIAIPPVVVVIASGTPTWKLSAAANANGGSIVATTDHNGAGATASAITAVKIA